MQARFSSVVSEMLLSLDEIIDVKTQLILLWQFDDSRYSVCVTEKLAAFVSTKLTATRTVADLHEEVKVLQLEDVQTRDYNR
jgi:hypothetical protein